MIYLDNAATTRVCREATDAAVSAMLENYGNTSSTHALGRSASDLLERSRHLVADALGAEPREICFTSGGTEACNLAIFGALGSKSRAGNHIITSAYEHDAVLKAAESLEARGFRVTYLPPDDDGIISPEALSEALTDDTALVSIMLVNNETGAVNPVAEYASELRRRGSRALFHTDAVQGFCKLPFTSKSLGADLISVSAHKIHGAKGAGALYIKNGIKLTPVMRGGGQENGLRSGTHALPAIAAFGEAARLASLRTAENLEYVSGLRSLAVSLLTGFGVRIISNDTASPYILSISLPGHRSETLMNALEQDGICVARSSACKKGARSHVLQAMRLSPQVIDGALRVSFSNETTKQEIESFAVSLEKISKSLFRRS